MKYLGEKRSERLEIKVEPTLKELFWDLCDELNISMADQMRILMQKEVEKNLRRKKKEAKTKNP